MARKDLSPAQGRSIKALNEYFEAKGSLRTREVAGIILIVALEVKYPHRGGLVGEIIAKRLGLLDASGLSSGKVDPTLSGHWPFDEGSGAVAKNPAGGPEGRVPAGLKWVDGRKGKAVAFNGKDYVVVKHCDAFNAPTYTIAAWTKLENTGDHHYIVWKAGPAFPEDKNARRFDLWTDLDGTVQGILHDEEGIEDLRIGAQTDVADGKWHHVALTYGGKAITLYVDGKKEAELTPTGPLAKNEHDLWIGGRPEGVVATGAIDEVRFYTRALAADEIAALAAAK